MSSHIRFAGAVEDLRRKRQLSACVHQKSWYSWYSLSGAKEASMEKQAFNAHMTNHALMRIRTRGIPLLAIEATLLLGSVFHVRGAKIHAQRPAAAQEERHRRLGRLRRHASRLHSGWQVRHHRVQKPRLPWLAPSRASDGKRPPQKTRHRRRQLTKHQVGNRRWTVARALAFVG